MEKATREAKLHTSWTDPNVEHDSALKSFIASILEDAEFTDDLAGFVEPLIEPGRVNSLATTLLKLTSPGIPDLYQGTELWDLNLVDPDNRRPVDYAERLALLDGGEHPKLLVVRRTLELRKARPAAFRGSYVRIETGTKHILGFTRGDSVAVLVPRLVLSRPPGWEDTEIALPDGGWVNIFTGEDLGGPTPVGAILSGFPVALLSRKDAA
jgi:(1->4)-alpha-D-glucan 1-alpha-D-glucosylmutase